MHTKCSSLVDCASSYPQADAFGRNFGASEWKKWIKNEAMAIVDLLEEQAAAGSAPASDVDAGSTGDHSGGGTPPPASSTKKKKNHDDDDADAHENGWDSPGGGSSSDGGDGSRQASRSNKAGSGGDRQQHPEDDDHDGVGAAATAGEFERPPPSSEEDEEEEDEQSDSLSTTSLYVGDKIMADYQGEGTWYPGEIDGVDEEVSLEFACCACDASKHADDQRTADNSVCVGDDGVECTWWWGVVCDAGLYAFVGRLAPTTSTTKTATWKTMCPGTVL